jgi:glycerate 2-kinase
VTRVLIAFDKFKGALSAHEACAVAARVLAECRPSWTLDVAPLSDGGEGFARILTEAAGGTFSSHAAHGPGFDGTEEQQLVVAPIGLVDRGRLPLHVQARLSLGTVPGALLAVLDMASVNGLALLPSDRRDVWRASSYGTGELILAAARSGARGILLGVGGSASSDLGLGALCALGLRFEAATGELLQPPLPSMWPRVQRVRGAITSDLPACVIATDVDNPVFGPRGSAAVYGPQKGLLAADFDRFEAEAERVAALLCEWLGVDIALAQTPGAGAAGGIAFGLMAALGARLSSGFDLAFDWLDLDRRLGLADWVLTGEGRFDASSLSGKGPGALRERARRSGRRSVTFAGAVASGVFAQSEQPIIAISPAELPLEQALTETARHLERAVRSWASSSDGAFG